MKSSDRERAAGTPFSERLRGALAKRNVTQTRLAEKLGFEVPTINRWANGRDVPRLENLIRIAEALDMSLDELCCGRMPAGEKEKNALRALAVTLIEDTREIYGDLQTLNKHARMLERWAKKYGLIEEEEE